MLGSRFIVVCCVLRVSNLRIGFVEVSLPLNLSGFVVYCFSKGLEFEYWFVRVLISGAVDGFDHKM